MWWSRYQTKSESLVFGGGLLAPPRPRHGPSLHRFNCQNVPRSVLRVLQALSTLVADCFKKRQKLWYLSLLHSSWWMLLSFFPFFPPYMWEKSALSLFSRDSPAGIFLDFLFYQNKPKSFENQASTDTNLFAFPGSLKDVWPSSRPPRPAPCLPCHPGPAKLSTPHPDTHTHLYPHFCSLCRWSHLYALQRPGHVGALLGPCG